MTTYDADFVGMFNFDDLNSEVGPYLFLRWYAVRGDLHLVKRDVKGAVPDTALPARARVLRTIDAEYLRHVLADVDGVLVMLRIWRADAEVWASATDAVQARAIVEEVVARVPHVEDPLRVPVQFADAQTGTRKLDLATRPWNAVRDLYPAAVATAVDALVEHEPVQDESRRLILWHGAPGTGKTTAVRALLQAWRSWADGVVVSDPEALLKDGRYLRRLLLDVDDEDRWQLLILEDAESLLRKDGASSAALAKLLNLADGLLGQGLRCLFLLTTNEPLTAVHPALVRPGRCLARVEFGALPAAQAAAVLGRPVQGDMTLAEVVAIRPLSVQPEAARVGQYL
jgi:hypothetical protein